METAAVVVQSDFSQRTNFCFGELIDKTLHGGLLCGSRPRSTASIRLTLIFASGLCAIWTQWTSLLQTPLRPSRRLRLFARLFLVWTTPGALIDVERGRIGLHNSDAARRDRATRRQNVTGNAGAFASIRRREHQVR